ncbi:hypothetical protein [Pseudomonas sp.]|uniref:hypothetical protein n=1 Tax=Pseudomonas sp. TaxID=306 RepID=UPI003D7021C5
MPVTTLKSQANRRLISTLLLLTGLTGLAGCHRLTPEQQVTAWIDSGGTSRPMFLTTEEIRQMEARRYVRVLRRGLADNAARENREGLQGSVRLRMKLDRQGDVLLCEAVPPDERARSDVAKLIVNACWSSVWEPVPEALQHPIDGGLEVIAPFIVTGDTSPKSGALLRMHESSEARRFFWDNVVAKYPVNTFGKASFSFTANAQGQVLQCDVTLQKHYQRPERFQADPALQKALEQQCLQLDLRQMPGFQSRLGEDGIIHWGVSVDYLPWKYQLGENRRATPAAR